MTGIVNILICFIKKYSPGISNVWAGFCWLFLCSNSLLIKIISYIKWIDGPNIVVRGSNRSKDALSFGNKILKEKQPHSVNQYFFMCFWAVIFPFLLILGNLPKVHKASISPLCNIVKYFKNLMCSYSFSV